MSEANFTIRDATSDDAAALLAHVRGVIAEPDVCTTWDIDEFAYTVEEERKIIADANTANSRFFVAEASGEVVGLLAAHGGKRRANRHEAIISISVDRAWRSRGVGKALMLHVIEWARKTGILTRLELRVFTRNTPAVKLYEQAGFVTEGVLRNSILRNGKYEENLLMGLLL
jgi:ribosomal protein S18 acetylase RimI-like enzyme